MKVTPPPTISEPDDAASHPDWFREPTRREHLIGAALFIGFGIFFFCSVYVLHGWWFRYVMLGLGVISMIRGLRHAFAARRKAKSP